MIYRVECEKKKGVLLVADEAFYYVAKSLLKRWKGEGRL